jgi:hypothetical protein
MVRGGREGRWETDMRDIELATWSTSPGGRDMYPWSAEGIVTVEAEPSPSMFVVVVGERNSLKQGDR